MIDFLNSIKSLIKEEKIHTDNNIFALHYKFTVIILVIFSILITSKQYFGEPIDCKIEMSNVKSLIDTYCWIHGTYVLTHTMTRDVMPGLGPDAYDMTDKNFSKMVESGAIVTQKYYQWVCMVFCLQALMFYLPRYLWKSWEGGRVRLLVKDLGGPLVTTTWNADTRNKLVNYLVSRKYSHNFYAFRFAFCEILNFLNVMLQIGLTDWFLSGHFISYGIGIFTYKRINPMSLVFPKFAKCTYRQFGHSGSEQLMDALCLLPLNIVNEKLFIFLWFWFFILTILSFYQILYRASTIISSTCREKLLRARCRYISQKTADVVVENFSYGDMFFLDLIAKNVNPIIYKELVVDIAAVLAERYANFNTEVTLTV